MKMKDLDKFEQTVKRLAGMKLVLIALDGPAADVDRAIADLQSNIEYDNLNVIVQEVKR